MARPKNNSFRIVGGAWRSRRISFLDAEGLRPTLDRHRETLFNWLQGETEAAKVLDLFCGSGALGVEALSRGAKHCTFVDTNRSTIDHLKSQLSSFGGASSRFFNEPASAWLKKDHREAQYDLAFLDPPFGSELLQETVDLLSDRDLMRPESLIYCEHDPRQSVVYPPNWQAIKQKKTTAVAMVLLRLL